MHEQAMDDAERASCYVESAQLCRDLAAKGQYLGASPLYPVATATSVRVRDGKRQVTDGPFAETREQLGGYYVIEAKDLDEAIGIAERIPPCETTWQNSCPGNPSCVRTSFVCLPCSWTCWSGGSTRAIGGRRGGAKHEPSGEEDGCEEEREIEDGASHRKLGDHYMARPMTPAEKQRFQGHFANLNVDQAVVTGEVSSTYNCIAWTVGVTDLWLWPGSSIAHFDTFYRGFGFARAGDGPIAAWGHSTAHMTHGSVCGPGHGPRWESKCGADLRIQHGLNELAGSNYGRVVAFYTKSRLIEAILARLLEETMKEKTVKSHLTAAQKKALREERERLPADVRARFEAAFDAWKRTWFSGGLAINSDPHTRAVGKEFDALVALGPAILPLVIEALADSDNFLALQLYDAIQPNERLIVQFEPGDERILEGEQGRARRVVQAWFTNQ